MKTMLILGSDRIAKFALSQIGHKNNLIVVIDRSTNIKRIARLVLKRRLSISLVARMFFCEIKRPNPKFNTEEIPSIKNNRNLLDLISIHGPARIILFRAGLVVNKEIISKGVPLLNIHCAKVPEYGGLGSIYRAIKDGASEQLATLHRVTTTIDKGEVFDVEPFQLDLGKSYYFNEQVAYHAGIKLLMRTLGLK